MSKSSFSALKAATQSRALDDQHTSERERDALVLILTHLQMYGYIETATTLLSEAVSLKHYEQADNLDLIQILKVILNCTVPLSNGPNNLIRRCN